MKLSQPQKISKILKENIGIEFTVQEIAKLLISTYKDEYEEKRIKTNKSNEELQNQVEREIYSQTKILKNYNVLWKDNPKPRKYYYNNEKIKTNIEEHTYNEETFKLESSLYDPFMRYLSETFNLDAVRIRESASKRSEVKNKNIWLYPDIVALEPLLDSWQKEPIDCFKESYNSPARLWSFELKTDLTISNVRESFFQAVSNSTWANEGYLVAKSINSEAEEELRTLSPLHGIGVIIFDPKDFSKSGILIPSIQRKDVDWKSINKLIVQNKDFKKFMQSVSIYLTKGYHTFNI